MMTAIGTHSMRIGKGKVILILPSLGSFQLCFVYSISAFFRGADLDIIQHNQIDMRLGLVAAAAVSVGDMIEMIIDKIIKTIVATDMTIAIQPISIR